MSEALQQLSEQRSNHIAKLSAIQEDLVDELVAAQHNGDVELQNKLSNAIGSIGEEADVLIVQIIANG